MNRMRALLLGTAQAVRAALATYDGVARRQVHGDSPGGDAQFDLDRVAERAVWSHVRASAPAPVAVYTEDRGLRCTGPEPQYVLIVDPVDGSRPAAAGLQMCTVSIAVARLGQHGQHGEHGEHGQHGQHGEHGEPTVADVCAAHVLELASGAWLYADDTSTGIESSGYPGTVPNPSRNGDLSRMFWSIEFNGHPMRLMSHAYQHLVDASANTGGVFVFNSASYSITRIITGQLDAYVDIGNRIMRDHPGTEPEFRVAGRGNILHLFAYDIAASVYLACRAGVTITDGYGKSLDDMPLLALDPASQRSCVAAGSPVLHHALLDAIRWDAPPPR
jgi:myo-inositol-1(or 4)-monophosphatase